MLLRMPGLPHRRCFTSLVLLFAPMLATLVGSNTALAAKPEKSGPGDSIVFLDGGFRYDLGVFTRKATVGRATDEDNMDYYALAPMLHAGFLTRISESWRVGGAFGYGASYTLTQKGTKGEDARKTELGQLMTADARFEWTQHLSGPAWLYVMPRAGISMVAAGGDLKEETDSLDDNHNVLKGPRLGLLFGGELGVRYQFTDWFSMRAGGGYTYVAQSLLKADRRGDAADSHRRWNLSANRINGTVALEASF